LANYYQQYFVNSGLKLCGSNIKNIIYLFFSANFQPFLADPDQFR